MRARVRTSCLLVAAIALAPMAAAADVPVQRRWQQIQTVHFRVVGDAGERELRTVAQRLEQLHELLSMLAPETTARVPDTTVIVFRDQRAYAPFQPTYEGKIQPVAGYFTPGPMNYITLLAGTESAAHSVVYHEYVHLVLNRVVGDLAPWMAEGLAEFYSTFETQNSGRTAMLGGMIQDHLWRLQQTVLPLATLVAVDHASPYYNERDKSSVFYAQSWALIHYLQLGAERRYSAKVAPFLAAIADGRPFATACAQVLGVSAEALDKELRNYVFSPVLYRVGVALPERITATTRLEVTTVPEAEVYATLGDLLTRVDGRPEAREHLEHALSLDASQPLANGALARVEAEAKNRERARELASRPPRQPTYQSEYYRAMALELVAPDMNTDAAPIEAALRQAVALNPTSVPALASLARRLASSPAGRDEALRLIGRAIALEPSREDHRLQQARIHLLMGDTKTARTLLGPLIARGRTPETKNAARQLMGYAAKVEVAAAEAAAPPEAPDTPSALPPTSGGSTAPDAPTGVRPDLRVVGPGEQRIAGTLTAIECVSTGLIVVAAGPIGPIRLRAKEFKAIDFISYRDDLRGSVSCGAQPPGTVLVTFRPDADATTAGIAVAIEYLPAGFKPPR